MTTAERTELLSELIARQRREGLSERQFAQRIGVAPATWNEAKTGKRPVGLAIMRGALAAYPDLQAETLFLLRAKVAIADKTDHYSESEA